MNKYDVLGVVGEGAYGVVLKCKNKDTNELVAIKKFKESEEDEVVRKTTLREVKILRTMRHENIVQLKEAFRRKGKLYLVFEFIEKSMLDVLEANPNGVDTENVRVLTCQLIRAIEYCHRYDVIHRDIKPENLLINPTDNALRLCDFGFARTMTGDSVLTDYVATRWYRAPELLLGSTRYGKDVDIWAVGCIMGELTDGQPLFAGESEVDQLFVIQKVLGVLIPEHMEMFLRNPRFLGIQFPDVSRPETLEKRYVRRMPKLQMQVLKAVLVMEPTRRLTARDGLRMPWFEGIKLPRSLRPPSHSSQAKVSRPDSSGSVRQSAAQDARQAVTPARGAQVPRGAGPAVRDPGHPPQQPALVEHTLQSGGVWHELAPEPAPDPRLQREALAREEGRGTPDPRGFREDLVRPATREEHHAHAHAQHVRPATREEQRMPPPRRAHEDPRLQHDDGRTLRGDDGRGADPRLMREDPRDPRMQLDFHGVPQHHHMHHHAPAALRMQQQQHQSLPQYHHVQHQASHQYKLPWEDTMAEDGPPPDYGGPTSYDAPPPEKTSLGRGKGRRSQQDDTGSGDMSDQRSDQRDRGTPSGRDAGQGGNFGFRSNAVLGGGGAVGSISSKSTGFAASSSQIPLAAVRHGASAGTGGSEEWPSNQGRGPPVLREPDYEYEKAEKAISQPRRKPGRQPGNLGGVPETPTRRSPDPRELPIDHRQSAQDAWRGEHPSSELHGGIAGLPSIHGGFPGFAEGEGRAAGGTGGHTGTGGSRAPGRLTATTPTPRDEDAVAMATRSMHGGFAGGGRWAPGPGSGDWPGLGGPALAPPSELGPVREPRHAGAHHDGGSRGQPDARGARRPDFGANQAY